MSDHFLTDFLVDPARIDSRINHETRSFMTQMLEFAPQPTSPPPPPTALRDRQSVQNLGHQFSSTVSSLISLVGRILEDLETNLPRLLSLNPSRRDTIAQYLEKLAGLPPRTTTSNTPEDPTLGLRRWIESSRSTAQNSALKTYFEEVALITLGQAILLKSWSDRGIRSWSESDLGRLNWALSTALKPHIPLDREGWQITRPNIYSWYNPSSILQHEIWASLEAWKLATEGPQFLATLLGHSRRAQTDYQDTCGYDMRFFQALWNHINHLEWNSEQASSPLKRNKVVFSPTLRDGSIVRTAPNSISWIGLESSPFQLMVAELMQSWWGPASPPLWCVGTGLEAHAKDQLTFTLGSPKPSVLSRIAEMEACDAAFVLEEQTIRAQGRNATATRFREHIEALPFFKRLRSAGTSLGALQACVALNKLRPGGIFIWAREEALGPKEGNEVLNFLLDRAKLVCEWDFAELEHSLPVSAPLYPKHLYLFQRETNIESRLTHRPIRHTIQGQIRSHVELPILLEDALQLTQNSGQPRGQWAILSHPSPTTQQDWLEKWPDPTSHHQVRKLDQLRSSSLPLAHSTTIRPTPDGDPNRNGNWSVHLSLKGLWLSSEFDSEGRKLVAHPLPRPGQEVQGHGFLILVPDEAWVAPLSAYLMSDHVQKWLDHHAERRGDRWILNEQVVKWIPIPKTLLHSLGVPHVLEDSQKQPFTLPLPNEWERLIAEVSHRPKAVREALSQLGHSDTTQPIHCALFVRTARALDYLSTGQHRLFSLVSSDGRIRWRELLTILPKGECVAISIHPKIRLTGSLPPHLPIGRMDRVKAPSPGILLATESGFSLHIGSDTPLLINMLWEQLEGISHPTWNELLQYLRIPRKVELAESTALDVLRSHGEQTLQLKDLKDLLASCQLY